MIVNSLHFLDVDEALLTTLEKLNDPKFMNLLNRVRWNLGNAIPLGLDDECDSDIPMEDLLRLLQKNLTTISKARETMQSAESIKEDIQEEQMGSNLPSWFVRCYYILVDKT